MICAICRTPIPEREGTEGLPLHYRGEPVHDEFHPHDAVAGWRGS